MSTNDPLSPSQIAEMRQDVEWLRAIATQSPDGRTGLGLTYVADCYASLLASVEGQAQTIKELQARAEKAEAEVEQLKALMQTEAYVEALATMPETYNDIIDHHREMSRRLAESRDELKHQNRALNADLLALRGQLDKSRDKVEALEAEIMEVHEIDARQDPKQPSGLDPLAELTRIAMEAWLAWDHDRDLRVSKILSALAGFRAGYRADIDALRTSLAEADRSSASTTTACATSPVDVSDRVAPSGEDSKHLGLTEVDRQIGDLVRAHIKGPFRPCVFYDSALNTTTVLFRDCSYVEGPMDAHGLSILRDNYRDQAVIGIVVSGKLEGLAEAREMEGTGELTFRQLSTANLSRVRRWHPSGLSEWSPLEWAGAMAGEAGEACNAAKKLKRIDGELANINLEEGRSLTNREAACHQVVKEVCDTIIYGALLVQAVGGDLETTLVEVFNRKSEEYGFPERLPLPSAPTPATSEEEEDKMTEQGTRGLWRNDPATPEGKYLVKRRDGSVVEWPNFVVGARDPAGPAALREYSRAARALGMDPTYCDEVLALADQFDHYRVMRGSGDPDGRKHREDDPATIAEMKLGGSA